MNTINDIEFGKLSYNDAYEKKEVLIINNNEYELEIIVQAFEDELITDSQRSLYKYFKENINSLFDCAIDALENYCDINASEIIESIEGTIPEDPLDLIKFTSVFFDRYGNFGLLCEVAWDDENGLAIKFEEDGNVEIGFQDIII